MHRSYDLLLASVLLGCVAGCESDPKSLARYTAGHADLSIELQVEDGEPEWDAFLSAVDTTIDGELITGGVSLEDIAIASSARFTRPEDDGGAFAQLCVSSGEAVSFLPQSLRDADEQEAPFMGIEAEGDEDALAEGIVRLRLLKVDSPSGEGAYSLWRNGSPPEFFMASCDGIDDADVLPISFGHDHYNMGFSEPGDWTVTYEASAVLSSGEETSTEFRVHYALE